MRKIFYILVTLFIVSCNKIVQSKLPIQKKAVTDTVAPLIAEEYIPKIDTLSLKSQPFVLNDLSCYWKHFFIIYDNYGLEIEAKLYDYKTKKIILEYEESPKFPEYYNYKSTTYFDTINKKYFDDFNFDGFKDFSIYYYGSMPMTSTTAIYLFDNKIKSFVYSGELSDVIIEERDTLKRLLKTSSWTMESTSTKIHHFDKSGKLIFSDHFQYPNDSTIVYYKKIIDQKIVEQRTETVQE